MIAIAIGHALGTVHMSGEPFGRIRQRFFSVSHAVRFDIGFVDQVETVFVAKVVPARIVRIMARTNRVDIERLHERDILKHAFFGERVAGERMMLVPVDALYEDRLVVDEEFSVFDFDLAETDIEVGVE